MRVQMNNTDFNNLRNYDQGKKDGKKDLKQRLLIKLGNDRERLNPDIFPKIATEYITELKEWLKKV